MNLAVKKPAIEVNNTENMMQRSSASSALANGGTEVISMMLPNTVPVLMPLCMMTVAMTMFIPVIRPIERSVPVSMIKPATPNARKVRGAACCMMFMMLFIVSSEVCLMIGVMIHSITKTSRITIYKPLRSRNCFLLKE